ncbi:MAG: hypothetical protein ACPG77_02110, partial [Nannocystaceae bacterium]
MALLSFVALLGCGTTAAVIGAGPAEASGEKIWREGGTQIDGLDPRKSLAPLVKQVSPAVVSVRSMVNLSGSQRQQMQQAYQVCLKVKPQEFIALGYTGKAIGEQITKQRI